MAALVTTTALLSGCAEANLFGHIAKTATAEDQPPPVSYTMAPTYKVGKPYQIKGVWYYPSEDWAYDETGIASWYGDDFHNKATANGEVFDMNAVSAAHKTLPMPSMVRVTNLENGRSLVARVNDRGPFAHGRIIDMSRRAAQLLGFERQGTAKVRVQILADESRILAGKLRPDTPGGAPQVAAAPRESVVAETLPPPGSREPARPVVLASAGNGPSRAELAAQAAAARATVSEQVEVSPVAATGIFVQAGSFSRYDNALRLSARLSGVGKAAIQQGSVKGQTVYRVRLGPVANVEEADRLLEAVIATGHQDAKVVVE